jgi:hypothetical protein
MLDRLELCRSINCVYPSDALAIITRVEIVEPSRRCAGLAVLARRNSAAGIPPAL